MSELKSKCCGALIDTIGVPGGTWHYRCHECKEACDVQYISPPFIPPSDFKLKALENPGVKKEYDAVTTESLYLDNLEGIDVNIYLINGVKLYGSILQHDDKTILLHGTKSNNLIYKSAIASIEVENERD